MNSGPEVLEMVSRRTERTLEFAIGRRLGYAPALLCTEIGPRGERRQRFLLTVEELPALKRAIAAVEAAAAEDGF